MAKVTMIIVLAVRAHLNDRNGYSCYSYDYSCCCRAIVRPGLHLGAADALREPQYLR